MKKLLYTALLSVSLLSVTAPVTSQASPQQQMVDSKVTNLGDADISIRIRFDAQGWQMWKQTIGENPSVLKREIKRMFSTVVLSDYRLERNDLEREATFHVHAAGISRYLGNGMWETDIDNGGIDKASVTRRKLNDTTYLMSVAQNDPLSGGIMQQEMTITLPEGAGKLQETTSEMGTTVLRYKLDPPVTSSPIGIPAAAGGSTLCLAGIGVLSMMMLGKRKETPDLVALDPPSAVEEEPAKSA